MVLSDFFSAIIEPSNRATASLGGARVEAPAMVVAFIILDSAFFLFIMASISQSSDYIIAYKFIKTTFILNYFCNRRPPR